MADGLPVNLKCNIYPHQQKISKALKSPQKTSPRAIVTLVFGHIVFSLVPAQGNWVEVL